jgi:hypothetical protein
VSKAGILAYNQAATDAPHTHMRKEDAEFLACHMRLERLTRKLYRALPPNSIFPSMGNAVRGAGMAIADLRVISLPNPFGGEIENCKFRLDRKTPPNESIPSVRRTRAIDTDWRDEADIRRAQSDVRCQPHDSEVLGSLPEPGAVAQVAAL